MTSYVETVAARVDGYAVVERARSVLRKWDAFYSKSTISYGYWSGARDGVSAAVALLEESLTMGTPPQIESAALKVEEQAERLTVLMAAPASPADALPPTAPKSTTIGAVPSPLKIT